MAGAAATQVLVVEDGSPALPVILGLLALTLAWLRRDRWAETLQRLRLRRRPAAR
jgi:MYXO-CTERM domain-containing protein